MNSRIFVLVAALAAGLLGCREKVGESPHPHGHGAEGEGWSVTAWGEHFEIFPEVGPLVAGQPVEAGTHVTFLRDFASMKEGNVAIVFRDGSGRESRFEQATPRRPGIFAVPIVPPAEGKYDLAFVVRGGGLEERIPAGRVRVGSASAPGGLIEPPKPPNGPATLSDEEGSSFLKEQQWKTEFATVWSRQGSIRSTVVGSARVAPPAGGEMILTATVDSVVSPSPWPHPGQAVAAGARIFRLASRATSGRSLSELESELAAVESDLSVARGRSARLDELLRVEATSRAEVERAKSTETALDAKRTALRRDLEGARGTGDSGVGVALSAPWSGRIAEIFVTPGQAVSAGDRLGRILKTRPIWLELALRPTEAERLRGEPLGATIRRAGATEPIGLSSSAVRIVSRVPVLDPATSSLTVLVEADVDADRLPIGSSVELELVLPSEKSGIVIPAAALVDDSGATIVWEQLSGESFARRPIRVMAREGDLLLVDGIGAGVRIVTKGGTDVRRATLLGSGAPEGHVH
jgi:RND family efflux transporter MFP subunit